MAGCQTARVREPLTGKLAGNDAETQLEFWHELAQRPLASNDDAFHGLLLYLEGEDPAGDYAARVELLKSRKMLPKNFDQPADQAVQRGTLAVALVRALRLKGGLVLSITRPSPRYATRELQYLALYPPSSPHQTFSGAEFVGIIGRVEDYQRGNPASVPAKVMPGKMNTSATQPAARL